MKLIVEVDTSLDVETLCHKLKLLAKDGQIELNTTFCSKYEIAGNICFRKRMDEIKNEISEVSEDLKRKGEGFPENIVQQTIDDISLSLQSQEMLLRNPLQFEAKSGKITFSTENLELDESELKLRLVNWYFNVYVESILRNLLTID